LTRLRVGLIGAGRIGTIYSEVMKESEWIELVAVADVDLPAAKVLASRIECEAYKSHEALADGAHPDAVIVGTPPNLHSAIALEMLAQGIHVICEKPFALTSLEAVEMLAAAESNGALLTMASKFRYVDDVRRALSIVSSGVLGELILLENTFASRVDMSSRWNADPSVSGGGVMIDNGTHSVDLIRSFLGPLSDVMAVEGKRTQNLGVEDTAQIFLQSHDGVRATIDLSWSIDKARPWYLEIYGSEGTIQIGWETARYRQRTSPDWIEFGSGYSRDRAMRAQVDNFASAILHHDRLAISALDALASVEVIEAAYRSLLNDHWIRVETNSVASLAR